MEWSGAPLDRSSAALALVSRLQRGLLTGSALVVAALLLPLGVLVRDGWAPLRDADQRASDALTLSDGPGRDVALALTQLGAPLLVELATLAIAAGLLLRRPRLAAYAVVTVLGGIVLCTGLKHLVDRVRPCDALSSCPPSSSFPSGHANAAAVFWTTAAVLLLPVLGRRAWALLALPLVVALTRVLLGVHYPSDVLAGLLVGGCWAAAWTAVFAAWKDERAGRDVPLEEGL